VWIDQAYIVPCAVYLILYEIRCWLGRGNYLID